MIHRFFLAVVLCMLCAAGASAFTGRVVGVADGDTITVLSSDNERFKIRLSEIDAPEKSQPFGMKSEQSLSNLCFGKNAEADQQAKDRYGRIVGRVYCAGIDANSEQVRRGMAWVYDSYVIDRSLYAIQDDARTRRIGLWADESPTQPWLWRRQQRN